MISNNVDMYFSSKKRSLILLAITAIASSRALSLLFNDPEGPNLLIVSLMTLVVFFSSYIAYNFNPLKINGLRRLFPAVIIQLAVVMGIYFCLK